MAHGGGRFAFRDCGLLTLALFFNNHCFSSWFFFFLVLENLFLESLRWRHHMDVCLYAYMPVCSMAVCMMLDSMIIS